MAVTCLRLLVKHKSLTNQVISCTADVLQAQNPVSSCSYSSNRGGLQARYRLLGRVLLQMNMQKWLLLLWHIPR
jgi:hypothetical protein